MFARTATVYPCAASNVAQSPLSKACNHPMSACPAGVSGILGATEVGGATPVSNARTNATNATLKGALI
jgi:hypothetical protein